MEGSKVHTLDELISVRSLVELLLQAIRSSLAFELLLGCLQRSDLRAVSDPIR